jgi:class 3 adenylate cyclase
MDVVVWLRSLGLGQYETAFRENEISEQVLPSLTAEDLKDLGVSIIGHRRKLLDAIAALRADASIKAPLVGPEPARPSAPTPTGPPIAEAIGERRHVTVMFCDMVGSTSISAGLDAEDWRDLVSAYLDAATAAVTEMGGHVAKKLGDGLMALFGYPVAQENDAERAARACLSIQRNLAQVNRKNAGSGKPTLCPHRYRNRPGSRRRLRGNLWGCAQYRGARAGVGRPRHGHHNGACAASNRRPFYRGGAGHPRTQRRARACDAVPTGASKRREATFGAAPSHAACRPRRGNRNADAALGASAAG